MSLVYRSVFALIVLSLSHPIFGQGFLRADGADIVDEKGAPYFLRGMGLGGYMVQEGYMMQTTDFAPTQHELRELVTELIGAEDTEAWYQAWRDNYLQEADVALMDRQGFNSIRLPMHYNLYTLPIEDEPVPGGQTWLEEGFARTDSLIAWCKARDMYVILDLHAAPGGQGQDRPISDRDPDKPSLWDSEANKTKTVALWRRLAERYADEPVVGGYDLLNEVNWELPGNTALRELYGRITDTIRGVDQNHLLIIEGNWFANDFTGLTEPWDDNMAYSPHKYWSFNDQESINFALALRDSTGVPLYLGETGENSNRWFRDAARLYQDNNMGWAWWPYKKMASVVGSVNSPMGEGYRQLLEYWKGNAPRPTAEDARMALMEQAELLQLSNSTVQAGVADALFRQVDSDETLPFADSIAIPGVLYPVNYDLGRAGIAYSDDEDATYHLNTNTFVAWNQGWSYRNDGVDIERSQDQELTNGYNLGYTADDEWLKYTIRVVEDGKYRVRMRVASGNPGGGGISLRLGAINATGTITVPNTGDWQTWRDLIVEDVTLRRTDNQLEIYIDGGGFNLGGIEFIKTSDLDATSAEFVDAGTIGLDTVRLSLNKSLSTDAAVSVEEFTFTVDGDPVGITGIEFAAEEARSLLLIVDREFAFGEELRISYSGTSVVATDGSPLATFADRVVTNNTPEPPAAFAVPGTLEAEGYYQMEGVRLETNSDLGGSQNVAFLDVGDYMDYYIDVAETGPYAVDYRTASDGFVGGLTLQLFDSAGVATDLQTVSFPSTGGWQSWGWTAGPTVDLPEGRHRVRLLITAPSFNLNLLRFSKATSLSPTAPSLPLQIHPNPTRDFVYLSGNLSEVAALSGRLYGPSGRLIRSYNFGRREALYERIDLGDLQAGSYRLVVSGNGNGLFVGQVVKR